MKKLMSMSLVLVLVLALGGLAFAADLGGTTEAQIPVTATIGAYAEVLVNQGVVFNLAGAAGSDQESTESGRFTVEANCDVCIELTMENPNWISIPYRFKVGDSADLTKENLPITLAQLYAGAQVKEYTVDGWISIPQISAIAADAYSTKIMVTVSQ